MSGFKTADPPNNKAEIILRDYTRHDTRVFPVSSFQSGAVAARPHTDVINNHTCAALAHPALVYSELALALPSFSLRPAVSASASPGPTDAGPGSECCF